MSKHTPGPWRLVSFDSDDLPGIDGGPDGSDSVSIVMFGSRAEANSGCDDGGVRGRTDEEIKANALLMVAAPDLLYALKVALNGCDDCNCERCTLCRAAIAKAEPEAAQGSREER